jgi:hypothetical protein
MSSSPLRGPRGQLVATVLAALAFGTAASPGTTNPPGPVTATEFGTEIAAAMAATEAFKPGTTLTYTDEEPNGGMGGVWPLTETSTVNPDGSLVYRLVATGTLEGQVTTLTLDLRCPSGSAWCWKRDANEFEDMKWHRVPRTLVHYRDTKDETVFTDGTWGSSDDYTIATNPDGAQVFTRASTDTSSDGSVTTMIEEWLIGPSVISYALRCATCRGAADGTVYRLTYSSSPTRLNVTAPRRTRIGSPGDRPSHANLFPVYINR